MMKMRSMKLKGKVTLNSDDATRTLNNNNTIPVRDVVLTFDSGVGTIINTTTFEINAYDHRLTQGESVTYTAGTTAIAGLPNAGPYFVILVSPSKFRLATSAANATAGTAINLTSQGVGIQTFSRAVTFDAGTAVNNETELITVNNH